MPALRVIATHALVLLACMGPWPGAARADALATREVVVALSASVLRIEAPREQGGFAMGSAVVLSPDLVVTNCHVTRDAREIFVVRGGARWPVTAQASDIEHDLCLLRVPQLRGTPVQLAESNRLQLGQTVVALGYTGGVGLQTSQGDVVGMHRLDGSSVVQSNNWFSSGASGGGLFDTQGRLVGILTFRLRGTGQAYFSAPTEWLRSLMRDFEQKAQPVQPLAPASRAYWQREAEQQPRFLRAASLLQTARFQELESLALQWLGGDATDAESWQMLGRSLQGQQREAEARWALGCAAQLAGSRHHAAGQPQAAQASNVTSAAQPAASAQAAVAPAATDPASKPCKAT